MRDPRGYKARLARIGRRADRLRNRATFGISAKSWQEHERIGSKYRAVVNRLHQVTGMLGAKPGSKAHRLLLRNRSKRGVSHGE